MISLLSDLQISEEFKQVLAKLRNDKAGNNMRTDLTTVNIGLVLYEKKKRNVDKLDEIKKNVQTDMNGITVHEFYWCFTAEGNNIIVLFVKHPVQLICCCKATFSCRKKPSLTALQIQMPLMWLTV